jgi:hypothetical protein
LSSDDEKSRVLDELWNGYRVLAPGLTDIIAELKVLPSLDPLEKYKSETRLLAQLQIFQRNFAHFTESPKMLEALQFTVIQYPNIYHGECCPPPSFQPYHFDYPPAGLLSLVCSCVELLVTAVYLPVLNKAESLPGQFNKSDLERDIAECYAYELCRIYAGLEISYGENNQDQLLPCFSPLFCAAFCCPPALRTWLWHKLAHFEQLCPTMVLHSRKLLAKLWDLPTLETEGFEVWKKKPPERRTDDSVNAEDIEFVSRVEHLSLED